MTINDEDRVIWRPDLQALIGVHSESGIRQRPTGKAFRRIYYTIPTKIPTNSPCVFVLCVYNTVMEGNNAYHHQEAEMSTTFTSELSRAHDKMMANMSFPSDKEIEVLKSSHFEYLNIDGFGRTVQLVKLQSGDVAIRQFDTRNSVRTGGTPSCSTDNPEEKYNKRVASLLGNSSWVEGQ